MSEITKCINEWNATIEALGQGKQTILIRKYGTTLNEFLLYPTISYANKDDVLDSFQDDCKSFVKDNVKYYLGRKEAKIWILRVYELDKPQMLKRSNGMLYANVDKPVKLEGKPVIPDNEFNKLKEEILNTK